MGKLSLLWLSGQGAADDLELWMGCISVGGWFAGLEEAFDLLSAQTTVTDEMPGPGCLP